MERPRKRKRQTNKELEFKKEYGYSSSVADYFIVFDGSEFIPYAINAIKLPKFDYDLLRKISRTTPIVLDPVIPDNLEELSEDHETMYLSLLLYGVIETKEPLKVIIMVKNFCLLNDLPPLKLKNDGKHVISEDDGAELLTPQSYQEYERISKMKYFCCGIIILTC